MADAKLRVNLLGDASSLNRSLRIASARLDTFSQKVSSIGASLSTRISLPLALAGGAAIKFASDVEESINKVDVAFGNSSDKIKEFAKTSLTSFGIAKGQALDMTALFGDMATGMGIAQGDAADLSVQLVGLAGDLSSFKNINIKEVTTALSGVFTGETESLKRLGIVMTEVNLKQFALSEGITKNIKDMTQQEKIMLRMQYIMKVTANAQGDFARTSESMANQVRQAQGSLQQLGEEFGQILLPVATKVVTKINEMIEEFRKLDENTKRLIVTIGAISAAIPPVLFTFGKLLSRTNRIIAAIAVIGVVAYKNFDVLIDGATKAVNKLIRLYNEFYGIQIIVDSTTILFKALGIVISAAFRQPEEFLRRFAEQISAIYNQTLSYLKVLNSFLFNVQGLGDAFDDAGKAIDRTMAAFTGGSIFNMDSVEKDVESLRNEFDLLMNKIKSGEMTRFEFVSKDQLIKPFEDFGDYVTNLMNELSNKLFGDGVSVDADTDNLFKPTGFSDLTDNIQSTMAASLMIIGSSFDSITERTRRLHEYVKNNAVSMGNALTGAFMRLFEAKNPIEALKDMLLGLIKRLVAAAMAAAVLSGIIGSFTGGSKLLKDLGGFKGLFSQFAGFGAPTEFANGGIVSAPTLGLMGEYAGARSNPEVIAPLDRLQSLMGGRSQNVNVTGQFRLEGQDLVVAVERANNQRSNLIG